MCVGGKVAFSSLIGRPLAAEKVESSSHTNTACNKTHGKEHNTVLQCRTVGVVIL